MEAHVAQLLGWFTNGVEMNLVVPVVRADEHQKMVNQKKATILDLQIQRRITDLGFLANLGFLFFSFTNLKFSGKGDFDELTWKILEFS